MPACSWALRVSSPRGRASLMSSQRSPTPTRRCGRAPAASTSCRLPGCWSQVSCLQMSLLAEVLTNAMVTRCSAWRRMMPSMTRSATCLSCRAPALLTLMMNCSVNCRIHVEAAARGRLSGQQATAGGAAGGGGEDGGRPCVRCGRCSGGGGRRRRSTGGELRRSVAGVQHHYARWKVWH